MRLVVTADLHVNHAVGRAAATAAIHEINRTSGDALLLVGDTSVADGRSLDDALAAIRFDGPKLFLCGNHELWTSRGDTLSLFEVELPRRVRAQGWHWLETEPFECHGVAVVGTVGWYDYLFAPRDLRIPQRFFAAKVSPGAAERLPDFGRLLDGDDVPVSALDIVVRWNDAKHVRLPMTDESFLERCASRLKQSLAEVTAKRVIAATHHVPLDGLLPPRRSPSLDFVRAYFGSPRLGEVICEDPRVSHIFCGHTHAAADIRVGGTRAVNIGSTYTAKRVLTVDVG